jgi:SPX domain protein involved in polyphosphate accumulation
MSGSQTMKTETIGTTAQRIERKYPVPDEQLPQVLETMSGLLPVYRFSGSNDWSSLRTTYLDTHDRQCFREYLLALPLRKKIRIRQYGHNGVHESLCWIELKIKDRNLSMKRRFRCTPEQAAQLLQGQDIERDVHAINTEEASRVYPIIRGMIQELNLRPAVRVDYERISFQSADAPGARVTVDREIRFRAATGHMAGQLNGMILEVKYNGLRPLWMPTLQRQLEISQRKRYSKFARSMKKLEKLRECEGRP